uniref:Galectin domain-containing protein n=1 Tax=Globodera rostochiensis TaxID=31243 RepID=A0A914IB96_GLORO
MLNFPGLVFILSTLFTFSHRTAADQQKSIHLTNPTQRHFKFAYNAMDQCLKKEIRQSQINSFSLKFKFQSKCVNGLLICYPGALDINGTRFIYGMVPAIQFRIKNIPGNDVAKKCAEKQKTECKIDKKVDKMLCTRDIAWHGLRVSKPTNTANQFLLELSITNRTYTFVGPTRKFSIVFGNRDNLLTQLLDQNDDRIKLLHGAEDDAIRNAYFERKAQKEVHLSNYVGLWMLGLDFLPMHVRETMHMHAYRDCGCEMHAWFTRPNDIPIATNAYEVQMPAKCATTAQNDKLVVNANAETNPVGVISGKTLLVKFRVNKKPKIITLRLEDKNKKFFILEMTISGQEIQLVTQPEQSQSTQINLAIPGGVRKNSTFLQPRSEKYMHVNFDVYEFFYEMSISGMYTRIFPWPYDWWTRANQTLGISRVWLSGDLYPDSAETYLLDDDKPRKPTSQSHIDKFQPLTVGDAVVFRGQVNKNAKSITFYMTHNSYKINTYIGTAVLKIQFNFTDGGKPNTLEASYQKWNHNTGTNQFEKFFNKPQKIKYLQRGAQFELRFTVSKATKKQTNNFFTVTLDTMIDGSNKHIVVGEFSLQVGHPINNIGSEGDMNMFTQPKIELAQPKIKIASKKTPNFFLQMLSTLLAVEDSVLFEGCLCEDATELRIFFLHNTVEPTINESNIPLGIIFKFHKIHNQNFMILHFNATKENGGKSQAWTNPSRLFAGEDFKIEIKVEQDGFKIYIHGAFVQTFEHQFPPWAVNFFRIEGDFKNTLKRVKQIRGPAVTNDLSKLGKLPIVYKVPSEKKFSLGNIISIHSKLANIMPSEKKLSLGPVSKLANKVPSEKKLSFGNISKLANKVPSEKKLSFGNISKLANKVPSEKKLSFGNISKLTNKVPSDKKHSLGNISKLANKVPSEKKPSLGNISKLANKVPSEKKPSLGNISKLANKVPSEKKPSLGNISKLAKPSKNDTAANVTLFTVSLLYGALETYETVPYSVHNASLKRIGGVVLHAKFSKTHVQVFERINTDHHMVLLNETELAEPINESFTLSIAFREKIELRMNITRLVVPTTLPLWAIEYVRIDGENLLQSETNIIMDTDLDKRKKNKRL